MESDSHRHSNQPILIFLLTIQKKIVSILSIILRPFLKIITFIKSNILKKENGKVSEEYIKSLICKSEEEGIIQTYEKNMIESIFKFNDTKSKDIMTSRKDTFSINIDDDIEENIDSYSKFWCVIQQNNLEAILEHKKEIELKIKQLKKIIGDEEVITVRPADLIEPEFEKMKKEAGDLAKTDEDVLAVALFPQVAPKFLENKYNKNPVEKEDDNKIKFINVTM